MAKEVSSPLTPADSNRMGMQTVSEASLEKSQELNNSASMAEGKLLELQDDQKDSQEAFKESLKYLQNAQEDQRESKVGKKLSESTQKAVITLVLTMLLASAFL